MGLFDEIRCEAPLPDGYDAAGAWFQTKSFPHPCMFRYTITAMGRLLDSRGNDCEPDGYISFYTRDEDVDSAAPEYSRWREYRARFSEGQLRQIVRVISDDTSNVYYGLASFRWFDARSFLFGDPDAERSENSGETDE
ncbi:MAG TPA: hypothetical protein VMT00_04505 [Thermoanaerobaculia bacterium]|nr:hypothetical protein [Thermoanaerobaculia bacterium]